MKTKKIKLFGKELNMAVNFGALIEYERLTGANALDATQFSDNKLEPLFNLATAMLRSNNAPADLPNGGRELLSITNPEVISTIITTTVELYMDFMKGEPGDETGEQKEDGAGKNA